jgi:hypothetical protein
MEMKIKHTFKGSKGADGYGHFAYIDGETNELVIGENWPHEGGELFRGTYEAAKLTILNSLTKEAPKLANSIVSYYKEHLQETGKVTLQCLNFGDLFCHKGQLYTVIDLNISACFVSTCGKESSIVCALNHDSYKVFCFSKDLAVELYKEDQPNG